MNTAELLNEIKTRLNLELDKDLASAIDADKREVHNWRTGHSFPGPYHCARIAEALARPPWEVVAAVQQEKEKDPRRRAYWRRWAGAATLGGLVILSGAIMDKTEGNQRGYGSQETLQILYYAQYDVRTVIAYFLPNISAQHHA